MQHLAEMDGTVHDIHGDVDVLRTILAWYILYEIVLTIYVQVILYCMILYCILEFAA